VTVEVEHARHNASIAVPKEAVQRLAEVKAYAPIAWEEYNRTNNFTQFAEHFQELIDLSRATALTIDNKTSPYDVLLQHYEKGMSSERLQMIFDNISQGLILLGAELERSPYWPDASWLNGVYDSEKQAKICRSIAEDMGFDTKRGRLDVVLQNPFTIGLDPNDVRMTTWYNERDITVGLTNTFHETGHSLYEQGRNTGPEWRGLPVSSALSTGMHESQSFLWERMICRSKPFQKYLLPKLLKEFPEVFTNRTWEELYVARNHWETEEIPFILRTMIFFSIEKDLIEGKMRAAEVPEIWDAMHEKMRKQLDMEPNRVALHKWCPLSFPMPWMLGAFGYLPTYALGAMYASQFMEYAHTKIPDLDAQIEKGNFTEVKRLLNRDIHSMGSLPATSEDLLQHVTGSKLEPNAYLFFLIQKYGEIYL